MLLVLHYYFFIFLTKKSWHTEEKTSRSITKNRFSKHNRVNLFSFKITASVVATYFYFPITQVFGSTLINMQVRSCCGNSSYFTTFRWIHLHNRGTRTPSPAQESGEVPPTYNIRTFINIHNCIKSKVYFQYFYQTRRPLKELLCSSIKIFSLTRH